MIQPISTPDLQQAKDYDQKPLPESALLFLILNLILSLNLGLILFSLNNTNKNKNKTKIKTKIIAKKVLLGVCRAYRLQRAIRYQDSS